MANSILPAVDIQNIVFILGLFFKQFSISIMKIYGRGNH